jgi:hypothetical protein
MVAAAAYHPGTKVTFPAQIGGASQTRSTDFGKSLNRPDLGQAWHYAVQDTLSASVYLYMLDQSSVPSGPNSPAVLEEFQNSMNDMKQSSKYEKVVLDAPRDCVVAPITFRCVTGTAVLASDREQDMVQLLVTGFRNHFLKVRLDWFRGSPPNDGAAERFVQSLVSAVLR